MNTPCAFYFFITREFSLKTKIFQEYFCGKQTLLSVIQLVKNIIFPVYLINVKKTDKKQLEE